MFVETPPTTTLGTASKLYRLFCTLASNFALLERAPFLTCIKVPVWVSIQKYQDNKPAMAVTLESSEESQGDRKEEAGISSAKHHSMGFLVLVSTMEKSRDWVLGWDSLRQEIPL